MIKTLQPRIARLPLRKTVAGLVGRSGKPVDGFYVSAAWKLLRNEIIKQRGGAARIQHAQRRADRGSKYMAIISLNSETAAQRSIQ